MTRPAAVLALCLAAGLAAASPKALPAKGTSRPAPAAPTAEEARKPLLPGTPAFKALEREEAQVRKEIARIETKLTAASGKKQHRLERALTDLRRRLVRIDRRRRDALSPPPGAAPR